MAVYVCMVGKDESDRYLGHTLALAADWADGILYYDDQSGDDSRDVAQHVGAFVHCRGDEIPPFLVDESAVRQDAWDRLGHVFPMQTGDLVVALDADEVLNPHAYMGGLLDVIAADMAGADLWGCRVHVDEAWAFDATNQPLIRTDGEWGRISGVRICRWRPDGKFAEKHLAGGSVPQYALDSAGATDVARLLHMGYANDEGRRERYERYSKLPGHSPTHIESILSSPTLIPYEQVWATAPTGGLS